MHLSRFMIFLCHAYFDKFIEIHAVKGMCLQQKT